MVGHYIAGKNPNNITNFVNPDVSDDAYIFHSNEYA